MLGRRSSPDTSAVGDFVRVRFWPICVTLVVFLFYTALPEHLGFHSIFTMGTLGAMLGRRSVLVFPGSVLSQVLIDLLRSIICCYVALLLSAIEAEYSFLPHGRPPL